MSHVQRQRTFRVLVLCLALAPLWHSALAPFFAAAALPQNQTTRPPAAPTRDDAASKTSRITVTSDTPLNDYSAHSAGNRFYVDVPASSAPRVQRGRGVKNVRVLKRGDRTVLEFTLQPGATARVSQRFNKLDVIIQQSVAAPAGSLSSPNAAAPLVVAAAAAATPAARNGATASQPISQTSPSAFNTNQPRSPAASAPLTPTHNPEQPLPERNPASPTTPAQTTGDDPSGANAVDDSGAKTNAAPASNQITQAQKPPAAPAANVDSATLSNNSDGLRLVRNWPVVFLGALLLVTAGWLVASRLKTAAWRESASPPSPLLETQRLGAHSSSGEHVAASVKESDEEVMTGATRSKPVLDDAVTAVAAVAATRKPVVEEPAVKSTDGEAVPSGAPAAAEAAKAESGSGLPVAIEESLGSRTASERAEAVAQLVFLRGEKALRRIGEAFADPSPQVRDAAARALFRFDKDYVASFTRVLRGSTPAVRAHIAAAMASSGLAAEAVGSLTGGTEKEIYESFSLLFLMAKAGEIKTLVRAIESHPNIEVRLAVVKLLSMTEVPAVATAFRRLQTDRALPVRARTAVAEALSQMSNQPAKDDSSID